MTHFVVSHRVARKPQRCSDCGRTIDPGELYRRGVGFDGTAWTWKDCTHCEFVLNEYDLAWDGEYNADHFHVWATDGVTNVADGRLQAGFTKRWRTASGALWPLPPKASS